MTGHLDVPTWTNGGGLLLVLLAVVITCVSVAWVRGLR